MSENILEKNGVIVTRFAYAKGEVGYQINVEDRQGEMRWIEVNERQLALIMPVIAEDVAKRHLGDISLR